MRYLLCSLLLLAGCQAPILTYEAPTGSSNASLLIRSGVGTPAITVELFDNPYSCKGRRLLGQSLVGNKINATQVIRTDRPTTVRIMYREAGYYCLNTFSFQAKKSNKYLLTTMHDILTCNVDIRNITDQDDPIQEVSVIKRAGRVNILDGMEGCDQLTPKQLSDEIEKKIKIQTSAANNLDDFKNILPN